MLIRYLEPIGSDLHTARVTEVLEAHTPPGVTVDVRHLTLPAELSGPMLPPVPLYLNEVISAVLNADIDGADAVIIGCCSDPVLQDAQRASEIPVVGPLQAAASIAASRGRNLGILFPDEHAWRVTANWVRRNLQAYGLSNVVTAIDFVPMHNDGEGSLVGDVTATAEIVEGRFCRQLEGVGVAAAQALIQREPVDAILFGCTIWGGMIANIADRIDALCLDPVVTSLHVAIAQVAVTRLSLDVGLSLKASSIR